MLQIITNHHERQFIYGWDVPESVVNDDYSHLDDDSGVNDGWIHYRNTWYHTSDFMRVVPAIEDVFLGWHGYHGDSFFSGVLIKLSDDGETYQIATYLS